MGKNSNIEWTDHTFNFWEGCTKVSPGCLHCYAEARNKRFSGGANWGKGAPRKLRSESYRYEPLKWNAEAESFADGPRVFSASLSDWLDDEVPIGWLAEFLALVRACDKLTWQLLSKRPENFRDRLCLACHHHFDHGDRNVAGWIYDWYRHGVAPRNVWIGTTIEDAERQHERTPHILGIPAAVRFLSCEPMLSEIGFVGPGIGWVICGGESGPGARPMDLAWARSLRDSCAYGKIPFFMKQLGGVRDKRHNLEDLPDDLRIRQFPA